MYFVVSIWSFEVFNKQMVELHNIPKNEMTGSLQFWLMILFYILVKIL